MISSHLNYVLDLTRYLLGLALTLQSIELLLILKKQTEYSIWQWKFIKYDFKTLPLFFYPFFKYLLSTPQFDRLIILRLILSVTIFFHSHFLIFIFLWLLSILISLKFRGVFNGGSDYMTSLVLLCMSVIYTLSDHSYWVHFAIWFLAVQGVLSYFIAGVVKVLKKNWRNGKALITFLNSDCYSPLALLANIKNFPFLASAGSWMIIIFELVFPLALISTSWSIVLISMAFLFHITNFIFFGLNRFIWIWLCTYPAIIYCKVSV